MLACRFAYRLVRRRARRAAESRVVERPYRISSLGQCPHCGLHVLARDVLGIAVIDIYYARVLAFGDGLDGVEAVAAQKLHAAAARNVFNGHYMSVGTVIERIPLLRLGRKAYGRGKYRHYDPFHIM